VRSRADMGRCCTHVPMLITKNGAFFAPHRAAPLFPTPFIMVVANRVIDRFLRFYSDLTSIFAQGSLPPLSSDSCRDKLGSVKGCWLQQYQGNEPTTRTSSRVDQLNPMMPARSALLRCRAHGSAVSGRRWSLVHNRIQRIQDRILVAG
jgi:hypothetical protein